MLHKTVLLLLLSTQLFSLPLLAQRVKISGFVCDAQSLERLPGSHILLEGKSSGTITNPYGFYSLTVPANQSVSLTCSYIGYAPQHIELQLKQDTQIYVMLQPTLTLDEVVVEERLPLSKRTEMGLLEIPMKQISQLPSLTGESDVLKALQLMPGIKGGNEGKTGIYVRGGGNDQNLVILDDVPLFYVNHLRDYISIFNTSALQSVKAYKGGFPARYGGRLSSVIDIRMREGNMRDYHGEATLGLMCSKLLFEGPIRKDTSSFIISARRFMYDLVMRPMYYVLLGDVTLAYSFWDINAKFNRIINPKNRIYFSFYSGDDVFDFHYLDQFIGANEKAWSKNRWGNLMGVFRWNRILSPSIFTNTTLNYSRFHYHLDNGYISREDSNATAINSYFSSSIHEFALKYDLEYKLNPNLSIRAGIRQSYTYFIPESEQLIYQGEEQNSSFHELSMYQSNGYLESEGSIRNLVGFNIGIRSENFFTDDTSFFTLQPRILLNIPLAPSLALKMSYARMFQPIHQLAYCGMGLSSDLWLPATQKLIPERSDQYSIGIGKDFINKGFELSIEAYYKDMLNLIDFKEGYNSISGGEDWEGHIEAGGQGKSYGLEFLLQKRSGSITGWIGYTYSKTTRQFENINQGIAYPFTYDRTHDFSIVAAYKLNNAINFSASWVFATGNAITFPVAYYYGIDESSYHGRNADNSDKFSYDNYIEIYEGKNTFRMKSFHKLDLAINWTREKKSTERIWSFSVNNAYNRRNPFFYYIKNENSASRFEDPPYNQPKWAVYQQSYFMIMPSVSWTIVF